MLFYLQMTTTTYDPEALDKSYSKRVLPLMSPPFLGSRKKFPPSSSKSLPSSGHSESLLVKIDIMP